MEEPDLMPASNRFQSVRGSSSAVSNNINNLTDLWRFVLHFFPRVSAMRPDSAKTWFTVHIPVDEWQSVETLELSPPLFQQRHIIQMWSRCSAPAAAAGRPVSQCREKSGPVPETPRADSLRWLRGCVRSHPPSDQWDGFCMLAGDGTLPVWPTRGAFFPSFYCWRTFTHLFVNAYLSSHHQHHRSHSPEKPALCGGEWGRTVQLTPGSVTRHSRSNRKNDQNTICSHSHNSELKFHV